YRVSEKEISVEHRFKGNIDTDATLIFTVGADAIAEYNGPALPAQVPVTVVIEDPEPPPSKERPLNPQPGEQTLQPPAQQQPQPEPPPLPEPPLNDLGACRAGMTLKPGESCSHVAGEANVVFSVRQDGTACREGGPINRVE
ncbi:MAG: hypothetical protein OXI86_07580, partial [Candidatus Poribacteria bacterium]|nr:hypothetical protein [Candidatus Poribacteria bacterium]